MLLQPAEWASSSLLSHCLKLLLLNICDVPIPAVGPPPVPAPSSVLSVTPEPHELVRVFQGHALSFDA